MSSCVLKKFLCSTKGTEEVQKPSLTVKYNTYMGGVNQANQMLSTHRTIKWWWSAFFHLLDLSIVNAYILHQERVLPHLMAFNGVQFFSYRIKIFISINHLSVTLCAYDMVGNLPVFLLCVFVAHLLQCNTALVVMSVVIQ